MQLLILIILAVGLPLLARAQATKPLPLADLAVYKGADREQALVSGAKKEGKLVWYTALAGGSYKELARGSRQNMASKSRHTAAPAKISFPRFWRKRRPKDI
jgi:hypothetical protein